MYQYREQRPCNLCFYSDHTHEQCPLYNSHADQLKVILDQQHTPSQQRTRSYARYSEKKNSRLLAQLV